MSPTTILFTLVAVDQLSFSMVIVIYGQHLYSLGASQLFVGMTFSLASFVMLIWAPIAGSLSDTKGRKTLLLSSLCFAFTANCLMALSSSLVVVIISRIFAALGSQIIPLVKTIVSDNLPKEEQISFFGKLPIFNVVGFIVGPLISGFLSEQKNGTYNIFLIISVLILINIALATTITEKETTTKDKKVDNDKTISQMSSDEIKKVIANLTNVNWIKYGNLFSIKLFSELTVGFIQHNLGLILLDVYDLRGKYMGYFMAALSGIAMVANIIYMKGLRNTYYKTDISGDKRIHHFMFILLLATITFSLANSLHLFMLGMGLLFTCRSLLEPTFTEAIMNTATENEKGSIVGAFESLTSLSGLILPLVSGFISQIYSNTLALQMSTVPALIGVIFSYKRMASTKIKTHEN